MRSMNPEEINKLIPIEGVDTRELYGAQDVYVEQIRSLAPKVKIVARGYEAIVLQHEIDHLSGILFYDHIGKSEPGIDYSDAIEI